VHALAGRGSGSGVPGGIRSGRVGAAWWRRKVRCFSVGSLRKPCDC
jgi:hypothetical protein